jgi:hypothetical protein
VGRWATVDLITAYLHTRKKDGKKRAARRPATPLPDVDGEAYEMDTGFIR